MSATVTVPVERLKQLLDISVRSLDWGSGFLDNDDVECLRCLAEHVGCDPMLVTPANFLGHYCTGHESSGRFYTSVAGERWFCCDTCGTPFDVRVPTVLKNGYREPADQTLQYWGSPGERRLMREGRNA